MLTELIDWWQGLQGFELILWGIALFFSLLFLLQSILSFFLGDTDLDAFDQEDGGDGYQFFTIRNLIAFFTMFGWAGLAAYKGGLNHALVILIALLAGASLVFVLYLLMRNSARLRQSGTLQLKNAVSQVGETYLRIPAKRNGLGKVHVQLQGRLVELDAMTDDADDIATGRPIQVVNILNNQILLVTSRLLA